METKYNIEDIIGCIKNHNNMGGHVKIKTNHIAFNDFDVCTFNKNAINLNLSYETLCGKKKSHRKLREFLTEFLSTLTPYTLGRSKKGKIALFDADGNCFGYKTKLPIIRDDVREALTHFNFKSVNWDNLHYKVCEITDDNKVRYRIWAKIGYSKQTVATCLFNANTEKLENVHYYNKYVGTDKIPFYRVNYAIKEKLEMLIDDDTECVLVSETYNRETKERSKTYTKVDKELLFRS